MTGNDTAMTPGNDMIRGLAECPFPIGRPPGHQTPASETGIRHRHQTPASDTSLLPTDMPGWPRNLNITAPVLLYLPSSLSPATTATPSTTDQGGDEHYRTKYTDKEQGERGKGGKGENVARRTLPALVPPSPTETNGKKKTTGPLPSRRPTSPARQRESR